MALARFPVLDAEGRDESSDADLVAALRRRDPGAELAAWNRFSAGVDRTLRRLLGPAQDSQTREDLLQEVFIRFFGRVHTLRDANAVRGFLTGICVHVVRGEIARLRRGRWLRLTAEGDVPDGVVETTDIEAREAVSRYYRVLDRLRPDDRSLFVARSIEGLTLEEVAELHGVSVSTAQRRLARASKRIGALVRRDPLLVTFVEKGGRA